MIVRPKFPRPDAALADRLRATLVRKLGDSKVVVDADAFEGFASDASEQEPVLPDAVVRAHTTEDIQATLAVASELGVAVTPRAAGSGKSGGCVPVCGGIVLCVMGMADLLEIDRREQLAVVEPGLILGDLFQAVEAEGLFYPPDPNSWPMCTLGGNIAENAGGPRAFKYGVTREYVLGLDVITATGEALTLGRRTKKGVTGYDLTALMVGSEGTLSITRRATLRLLRKPAEIITMMALFPDVRRAALAVEDIVAAGLVPRCLELVDDGCLRAIASQGVPIDARAGAMLIIEVDGDDEGCAAEAEQIGDHLTGREAVDVLAAQGGQQREKLWAARRDLSYATRKMARYKISEDVVVPRSRMADLIDEVAAISEATGVRMLSYGHAGDGNLHVNYLWDDPAESPAVERGLEALFRAVVGMRGTLTGEHGVGTSKSAYLAIEQSEALIAKQRQIKAVFDPRGILNPGKIFPRRGHGSC